MARNQENRPQPYDHHETTDVSSSASKVVVTVISNFRRVWARFNYSSVIRQKNALLLITYKMLTRRNVSVLQRNAAFKFYRM
jgi:hypothetical protein